ncbi:molecular chaperone DnaK [Limnobacter sp. SAORIC-690]|uniref:molecular chaperone DnaK n=1 Tax=Limnobacter sp. SAORIC-690 TaxID=1923970 RepID=UPI000CF3A039|nr:molecular chaperone DnaK [Limnobacter sp. SAORIC-690]
MKHLKDGLEQELQSIKQSISEARKSSATVVLDQTSVGRLSRMDALQQQAMAKGLIERLQTQELKVISALKRFDANVYGLCCQCEEELPLSDLEKDPTLLFCAGCRAERSTS